MFDAIHSCLLDGMWLVSVHPVVVDGVMNGIDIRGAGFEDKMLQAGKDGATAIEVFRDKLMASPHFSEDTQITAMPGVSDTAAPEFTIRAALKSPIRLGAVPQ
mgnify:FL=1